MNTRMEEEQALVELAQTGDGRAFETLIRRYAAPLSRFLQRFVHDSADIEDAVQETFIKAYLSINQFRGESAFSTWIFRIGINVAKQSLALKHRQGIQLISTGDDAIDKRLSEAAADFDTPDAKLETKEMLALLDAALDALPREQRASFELRELEGLSYEEIAWQMQCPVGTVRSRIHRARDALVAALKSH